MPTDPTTPRRTSKNRRSAPVTTALLDAANLKGKGVSDLSSVQERIRQWQEQDPLPGSPPPACEPPLSDTENADAHASRDLKTADRTSKTPRKSTSGLADPLNKEALRRPRSSSTPRKRVVSDDHWKQKTAPRTKTPSGDGPSPASSLAKQRQASKVTDEKASRLRRTLANERLERADNFLAAYRENDQTKRTSTNSLPRSTKVFCDENAETSAAEGGSVIDQSLEGLRLKKAPRPSTSVERKERADRSETSSKLDEPRPRRSLYTETLAKPVAGDDISIDRRSTSIRSRKPGILGQAKDLFSRNPHLPPTSNRVPSIEAWLADQPDPFLDNDFATPEAAPQPDAEHSRPTSRDMPPPVEKPHKSRERVDVIETRREHGTDSQPGSHQTSTSKDRTGSKDVKAPTSIDNKGQGAQSVNKDSPQGEDSPIALRRRGAKSARKRVNSLPIKPDSRAVRTDHNEDQLGDLPLGTQSRESMANTHRASVEGELPSKAERLSTILSIETSKPATPSESGSQIVPNVEKTLKNTNVGNNSLFVGATRDMRNSIRSTRSSRSLKARMAVASLTEVLECLESDELRYMRELVTLVDGVIPVLLQCVLSKSDTAAAAGLFGATPGSEESDLTQPIVDMGVALERLKTLHKRLPTHDLNAFLSWAQSARRVYLEYLTAWRLGFQNVIVNLAPLNEQSLNEMNDGLSRDDNGDVVNSEGQKVDVAYLLKRPLVRIKNLAKLMKRLAEIKPSVRSSNAADEFAELLKVARRRSDEEQSRLQDEEAQNMDTTKTRDLTTLAALPGVTIPKYKRVKAAKDHFNLTLCHSSGQRLDCIVELILRDDGGDSSLQGDLLVCEVDKKDKWLLFPPLELDKVSARHGDNDCEVVVYVRGATCEFLVLQSDDVRAATEWVQMLGTNPAPPTLNRSLSFISRPGGEAILVEKTPVFGDRPLPSRPPFEDTQDMNVPIGEPSVIGSQAPERKLPVVEQKGFSGVGPSPTVISQTPSQSHVASQKEGRKTLPALPESPVRGASAFSAQEAAIETPKPALRRTKGISRKPYENSERVHSSPLVPTSATVSSPSTPVAGTRKLSRTDDASREWMSSPTIDSAQPDPNRRIPRKTVPAKPDIQGSDVSAEHQNTSSASKDHANISHTRSEHEMTPRQVSIREQWASLTGGKKSRTRASTNKISFSKYTIEQESSAHDDSASEDPPTPPKHRSRSASTLPSAVPQGRPDGRSTVVPFAQLKAEAARELAESLDRSSKTSNKDSRRRPSSPLKREYAPSVDSGILETDDESVASSSSESYDGTQQNKDRTHPIFPRFNAPPSASHAATSTLAPSNSASQGPYRQVPQAVSDSEGDRWKTIATVSYWGDKGAWVALRNAECSVVISPGLVEVYKMSAAHSKPEHNRSAAGGPDEERDELGIRPLLAFEVTPLVALHLGTGLDVNVRSPPTPRSIFQGHTTVLFRSRSPAECRELYLLMNHARMTNPTWEALSRARPEHNPELTFNTGRGTARHSRAGSRVGSFFKFGRRASYRAPSAFNGNSPSVAGASDTSAGSISSAINALRRLSGGSVFNLNRSSVLRKEGRAGPSGTASLYTSSSGGTGAVTGAGSGATSPAPSQLALNASAHSLGTSTAPGGMVNNIKMHLYMRALPDWNKMGAGLLSILPATLPATDAAENQATPTPSDPSPPATASGSRPQSALLMGPPTRPREPRLPSSYHTPHRVHGDGSERRVVVTAKVSGEVMLDVTLHESCFERVGRRGIALGVWEEHAEIMRTGGVVGGKNTTYLIQMKTEAEAAWVFNQVGRLRY